MTPIGSSSSDSLTLANRSTPSDTASSQSASPSLIDRLLAPPPAPPAPRTPVEQGQAAREQDLGGIGEAIGNAVQSAVDTVKGVAKSAAEAITADHPIQVGSTVTNRPDGTKVTTVHIDVAANFRVDGGTLPSGRTATQEARSIERSIERDFSKTYTDANGNVTRYVTDVNMTVNRPAEAGREQFVLVDATDSRLQGGLGIAPGFEKGRTAFVSDEAGARTAPHEFGHLAGLRHTAQVDQGCVTEPGIDIENLMSQTGCSPTSQQIERSQLQQIFRTPDFR